MIEKQIKQKILKELEKIGNVLMSCLKYGVDRSTFYRWKDSDPEFKMKAEAAIRHGRENLCDIAEHGLIRKLKEADMNAIKYALSHNSKYYKQKRTSKVLIEYRKQEPTPAIKPEIENLVSFVDFSEAEGPIRETKTYTMSELEKLSTNEQGSLSKEEGPQNNQ